MVQRDMITALSFDGVLCDSEPEQTRAAWRAAKALWPDVMESAAQYAEAPWEAGARRSWAGGAWGSLQGTGEDGLPNWLAAKIRLLHPIVDAGSSYESMLLMRLCADEALAARGNARGQRPLTTGEISTNWPELCELLHSRYELHPRDARELFDNTRDAWLDADPSSWLAASPFYPGVVEAVGSALERGAHLRIVTTKQTRFVQALLREAGLPLDDGLVCGLDAGSQADALWQIQSADAEAQVRYVEDRVDTLRAVANDARLFGVQLLFAEWGYSNPSQQARISAMPRIRSLADTKQLQAVLHGQE